jgi:hypothetical protein
VLNVFQDAFESFNHFKKRIPSKSEFREVNFRIFMEQFKNVRATLIGSREIFASDLDLLLIIRNHSFSFLFSADALEKGRRDWPYPPGDL